VRSRNKLDKARDETISYRRKSTNGLDTKKKKAGLMRRGARNKPDTTTRVVIRILHAMHDGEMSRTRCKACQADSPRSQSRPVPLSLDYAIGV